jgi:hypothetical protein
MVIEHPASGDDAAPWPAPWRQRCIDRALGAARRRQRSLVYQAARLLTALGVRVEVRAPSVACPRPSTGRLVVVSPVSWIDDLVLTTVVRNAGAGSASGQAAELLRRGVTVLVLPEATTTAFESGLGPFGRRCSSRLWRRNPRSARSPSATGRGRRRRPSPPAPRGTA